ncbi:MAG: SUMF1/EgtB/PvdO family nonheme iron enzyme, partial [Deltaproteobacteria bacterium]|nr:SUMF1/EgtB/PvdO family nonheme iron enzyme [Deltaproteobacteria bacterium]
KQPAAVATLYQEAGGSVRRTSGNTLTPVSKGLSPEMMDALDDWSVARLSGRMSMTGTVEDVTVQAWPDGPHAITDGWVLEVPLNCACAKNEVASALSPSPPRRAGCDAGPVAGGPGAALVVLGVAAGLACRRRSAALLAIGLAGVQCQGGSGSGDGDLQPSAEVVTEAGLPDDEDVAGTDASTWYSSYTCKEDGGWCDVRHAQCEADPGFAVCVSTSEHLNAMVAFGYELFVAGSSGLALHHVDGRWDVLRHDAIHVNTRLNAVFGPDPEHVYFAAADLLLRWDGSALHRIPTGDAPIEDGSRFFAGSGVADAAGTIVVSASGGLLRYDGTTWDRIPIGGPFGDGFQPSSALVGTPTDLRLTVSRGQGSAQEHALARWDGSSWSRVDLPWGASANEVVADAGAGRVLVTDGDAILLVAGTQATAIAVEPAIAGGICRYVETAIGFMGFAHVEGVGDVLGTSRYGLLLIQGGVARPFASAPEWLRDIAATPTGVYSLEYHRVAHRRLIGSGAPEPGPPLPGPPDCGPDDCRIPAGPYCDPATGKRDAVAADFRLDRHEVTNGRFAAFLADPAGAAFRPPVAGQPYDLYDWSHGAPRPDRLEHPVAFVSPKAAEAFCAREGKRLPTAAEFHRAWSAGRVVRFPWGNDARPRAANLRHGGDPFEYDGFPETTPVGWFDGSDRGGFATEVGASAYGPEDLMGNLAEIVTAPDGYHECGGSWWTPAAAYFGGWSTWMTEGALLATAPLPCPLRGSPAWGLWKSGGLPAATWMTSGFRCARDAD